MKKRPNNVYVIGFILNYATTTINVVKLFSILCAVPKD
jgi:hypothetical protein